MRRFPAMIRGSFRPFRPAGVVVLVLLAVTAIAVTPTPRASADSFYKICSAHLDVFGLKRQDLTLIHESKWDTDHWIDRASLKFRLSPGPFRQYSSWKAKSEFARGCHTTVQYSWPGGFAEFSMTYHYDDTEILSCTAYVPASCWASQPERKGIFEKELVVNWHLELP